MLYIEGFYNNVQSLAWVGIYFTPLLNEREYYSNLSVMTAWLETGFLQLPWQWPTSSSKQGRLAGSGKKYIHWTDAVVEAIISYNLLSFHKEWLVSGFCIRNPPIQQSYKCQRLNFSLPCLIAQATWEDWFMKIHVAPFRLCLISNDTFEIMYFILFSFT